MNIPILHFGKHKGKPVNIVSHSYQYWLIDNCESFLKEKYPELWEYLDYQREEIEDAYRNSIPDWFDLIDFD